MPEVIDPRNYQPAVEGTLNDDESFYSDFPDASVDSSTTLVSAPPQKTCLDQGLDGDVSAPVTSQENLDKSLELIALSQQLWKQNRIDEAIDALDQAYNQIMEVDEETNPDLIQQKDDIRYLISKRLIEVYSSRHVAVKGTHKAIPIVINNHVQSEIDFFTNGGKNFFQGAYRRSGLHRPMIIQKLKEAGMPEELAWLPLIESGFKTTALSPARALGPWQFIASTGYKYGLTRDEWIDERMDPVKSTEAAINYLKELHNMFGDWLTVLAAYNCGEGRVLKVIRTQKINYMDNFWDLYEKLPRETARYVPQFLATLLITKEPDKYGINSYDIYSPVEYEVVNVHRQLNLKDIASTIGFNQDHLEALNGGLRKKVTPPTTYELRVPKGICPDITAKIASVPSYLYSRGYKASDETEISEEESSSETASASEPKNSTKSAKVDSKKGKDKAPKATETEFITHKVKKGESINKIAKLYNANIKDIKNANKIKKLKVGMALKIPVTSKTTLANANAKKCKDTVKKHKVGPGDSLWSLARRYGTTTNAIKKVNNIKGNCLQKDQVLVIPRG
jgi:membrane-bound lytic murein transglycosylase D